MISLAIETLASDKRATIDGLVRSKTRSFGVSSIHISEHGVDGGDDRHRVGDEPPTHHVRQALDVDERRRPHVDAVRAWPAVAGDVATELTTRALDGDVDLALGHLEALGEDLEVVDQCL